MTPSDEPIKYITCSCQHCGGHIKFDPKQLHKGETRTAECPHCHLETILFIPQTSQPHLENQNKRTTLNKHSTNENVGAATKFELFVLQLTRFVTLAGAALAIVALTIITIIFSATFLPERPETIRAVSYEEIVADLQPQPNLSENHLPTGSEINTLETIPEPVANFIANHPDFKLDVAQMSPYQRSAFLNNLTTIIQKANANRVSDAKLVQIVELYATIWPTENAPKPTGESILAKSDIRNRCLEAAPMLFGVITVLCLILVSLAIERSIRRIAERASYSQGNQKND
jgi:hypothetical protein